MTEIPDYSNVWQVILLIVPGFLTLKIASNLSDIHKRHSDFEILIFSLICSIFNYLIYVIAMNFLFNIPINTVNDAILSISKIEYFTFLVIISILSGPIIALIVRLAYHALGKLPSDAWSEKFSKLMRLEKGCALIVYCKDGKEYKGALEFVDDEKRELSIRKPIQIIRSSSGKSQEMEAGTSIFFTENDILRVCILNDNEPSKPSIKTKLLNLLNKIIHPKIL